MEEGVLGPSATRLVEFLPRCLDSEARRYNTAIKRLSERDREILFTDYVAAGRSKTKAHLLGIAPRTYFRRRDVAHVHLLGTLEAPGAVHNNGSIAVPQNYNEIALSRP